MKVPRWLVTYEGVDVTDELTPMVLSVGYTDNVQGESDELELELEDRTGRWREGWFPSPGDRVSCQLGYDGEPLLSSGEFQVDDIELQGPPDTVSIRALAMPMTDAHRTKKYVSYELTTLRAIASLMAQELELEVVGEVADVPIFRATQDGETTVAFLRRLSLEYGYAFQIRPPSLVFFEIAKLEAQPAVMALHRTELSSYRLSAPTQETYAACEVSYFDAASKETRRAIAYADHARRRIVLEDRADTPRDVDWEIPDLPTRTLREGSRGDDVRKWQQFLLTAGFDPQGIDGIFGPKTRRATVAFQQAHAIKVDGIAGPETYRTAAETGFGQPEGGGTRAEVSGAILRKTSRVETIEQAQLQAKSFLAEANRLRAAGSLSLQGDPRLVSGVTISLTGLGRLDGTYLVQTSRHKHARGSGYTTELEISFV